MLSTPDLDKDKTPEINFIQAKQSGVPKNDKFIFSIRFSLRTHINSLSVGIFTLDFWTLLEGRVLHKGEWVATLL